MSSAPVQAQAAEGALTGMRAAAVFPRIALAVLIALQIALILTHDAWRDELQSLMLAEHSGSLRELVANLRYEGHPALWYLVLRAAAPLGGSETLKLVQLAVALSTIAIVWTRAPFSPWTRLLILASYLLLFEWGAIARSYGLGAALYFAFLALNRRPLAAYLLLGLVANISAHFLMLAGVSALFLLLDDKKRRIAGPALFAVFALVAVATAWPAGDASAPVTLPPTLPERLAAALDSLSGALMPLDPTAIPPRWENLPQPASLIVGPLVPLVGVFAFARRSGLAAALFIALCAAILAFTLFVYPAMTRHTGVIFLFLIGIEWMLAERDRGPLAPFSRAWIALLAICGIWMSGWALALPFNSMRETMRRINERELENAQWAAYPPFIGVELSARLDRPYYDPQRKCLAWFQRWDTASGEEIAPEALNAQLVTAAQALGGRILLLSTLDFDPARTPSLERIADFAPGFVPEPMHIYEVTVPTGHAPALSPCG